MPVACCLMPVFLAFGQEYYRWTDDSGAVHFTDNLYSIPEKFRAQAQKKIQAPSAAPAPVSAERSPDRSATERFVVPFRRSAGNHILVEGVVNGRAGVNFILDTGAAASIIPRTLALELGMDLDRALLVTAAGIGGSVDLPLVEVESINVGGAEARDLEVTVQQLPFTEVGALGLLGADFLLDYRVDIEYAKNQVILERQADPYGGHTFEWWQQRFRRYSQLKAGIEAGRARAATQGARDHLDSQLRIVDEKISNLETRASQAGIPREYRQ